MVRFKFPRASRLTESGEYARVREEGRSFHGRYMVVGVSRGRKSTRVGLVASRRVGNAVTRNRLRRRLRELVRLTMPGMVEGIWVVVVIRAAAGKANWDALRSEFMALGRRGGIFAE